MTRVIAVLATVALVNGAALAAPASDCDVPEALLAGDSSLARVGSALADRHRLDISVVGTGSSSLAGPDGARFAYPARLQAALGQRLPGNDVKVTTHVRLRRTTEEMVDDLKQILADDKPVLVIWQAGTVDALRGVEPDDFRASLESGIDTIAAANADVILMNMQYSPRTAFMLGVSAYADAMHWVAQERGVLLFDRLAIMRYWSDAGIFDLYATTKDSAMARRVHDCIGRALALQIINSAHPDDKAIKQQIDETKQ